MEQGTVKRFENTLFPYQGWPTVCRDKNGTLYVACSGHRVDHVCPFGKNYLYKSTDNGNTWSGPQIINDTFLDDRDAGIAADNNGNLVMSCFNHPLSFYQNYFKDRDKIKNEYPAHALIQGMMEYCSTLPAEKFRYGSFTRRSTDGGATWEEAEKSPVTSPHGPVFLKSGELFWLGKEFYSGSLEKGQVYACSYSDRDWKIRGKITLPSDLSEELVHEPDVLELPNGELLGALRVHTGNPFTIYLCRSSDGGVTWTEPQPTGIDGSPPHLMLHSSGAVIMTYARRAEPYSERAVISYDGGKSFGKEIILSTGKNDDLGYPSTVELDDGSLLTVYYQYDSRDDYASVMYTKWNID